MPRLLATVEQLRRRMNMQPVGPPSPGLSEDGSPEDELLLELLAGASESVELETGRAFLPDPAIRDEDGDVIVPPLPPVVRVVSAFGSRFCQARDLREAVSIVADGVDVTARARLVRKYPEWPAHALMLPRPADQVVITGRFGFESVPQAVQNATLGWAQRAYHEHRARMSDSIELPDGGVASYYRKTPAFVAAIQARFSVEGL